MITGIVDIIFTQIIKLKSDKKIVSHLSEMLLMFLVFYLFVMIYSQFSTEIVIKNNGILYISVFLLTLYTLVNVIFLLSRKMYNNTMTRIQVKHNTKK